MRVIVADREPAVRRALRILLTQDLAMDVLGELDRAEALESQVGEDAADLLIVDWQLICADAPRRLTAIRQRCPALRIIVLGLPAEIREAALAADADAFISKLDAPDRALLVLQALAAETDQPTGGTMPLAST